eukprot:jgi/Botrbrau1/11789/Bobra.0195s0113.1
MLSSQRKGFLAKQIYHRASRELQPFHFLAALRIIVPKMGRTIFAKQHQSAQACHPPLTERIAADLQTSSKYSRWIVDLFKSTIRVSCPHCISRKLFHLVVLLAWMTDPTSDQRPIVMCSLHCKKKRVLRKVASPSSCDQMEGHNRDLDLCVRLDVKKEE